MAFTVLDLLMRQFQDIIVKQVTKLNERCESLRRENEGQKNEIQRMKNEVNRTCNKLSSIYCEQPIKELRIKANEVDVLKKANAKQKDEIQRLKVKEGKADIENTTLKDTIQKLKNERESNIREINSLKQENAKQKDQIERQKHEIDNLKRQEYANGKKIRQLKDQDEKQKKKIEQLKNQINERSAILKEEKRKMENELQAFINNANAPGIIKQEDIKQKNAIEQLKHVGNAVINEIQIRKHLELSRPTEYKFVTKAKEIEEHLATSELNLEGITEELRNCVGNTKIKRRYHIFKQLKNKYRNLGNTSIELTLKLNYYEKEYIANREKIDRVFNSLDILHNKITRKTNVTSSKIDKWLKQIRQFTEEQNAEAKLIDKEYFLEIVNTEKNLYEDILQIIRHNNIVSLMQIIARNDLTGTKRNYEELDKDLENSINLSGISAHKKKC